MGKPLVVITGASSGFGREMAYLFSEKGYPLLLLSRRVEVMEKFNLPNTLCRAVDVADYEAFTQALNEAEALYGPLDLLINNAGQMLLQKAWDQDPQEWDQMIDVNLKGVLNGSQIALKRMLPRKTGTIINVSSTAGFNIYQNHAAYSATKFAVHGLTDTLRMEAAHHNIRVMLLSPGAAETDLLTHTTDEKIRQSYTKWKKSLPEGAAMDPYEVAKAALFVYEMPQEICVRELVISSTHQAN